MLSRLGNLFSSIATSSGGSKDFPYTSTPATQLTSLWSYCRGNKKTDGTPVAVLSCEFVNRPENEVKAAQVAHVKLRTMRHPNILKYIDGFETASEVKIVTEVAVPLEEALEEYRGNDFFIKYGLLQLLKGIDFLNNQCGIVHGNICLKSVFADAALEWKLAGLEYSHAFTDSPPAKSAHSAKYDPPEVVKGGPHKAHKWSADMWGLGVLIYEVYNGELRQTSDLRNTSKIPKGLVPHYCSLVSANPRSRPNPKDLLEEMRGHGGYLSGPLISLAVGVEELHVMETPQRKECLATLNKYLDSFPQPFCTGKVLTGLLNAFEFSSAGVSILEPLFKIGQWLKDSDEYQVKIVPCVVKLFSSTDRATRIQLLKQMDTYAQHLRTSTASKEIFPNVALGFTDSVAAVREETVKAMVLLAPKLDSNVLNNQLLKYLAKCQMDQETAIRTNTTICISKIAQYLDTGTQQRVLASAFLRSLRDPFPPSRTAGLNGLAVTSSYYTPQDVANKILPALSPILVDPDKTVRDKLSAGRPTLGTNSKKHPRVSSREQPGVIASYQAFHTVKHFVQRLEEYSENPKAKATEAPAVGAGAWSWVTAKFYKQPQGPGGLVDQHQVKVEEEHKPDQQGGKATPESVTRSSKEPQETGEDQWGDWEEDHEQPLETESSQVERLAEGWGDEGDEWESFEQPKTSDGWDDNWGDDFSALQTNKQTQPQAEKRDVPLFTMKDTAKSSASGWGDSGWDEAGWGDPFADVQPTKPPPTATAKSQTAEESRQLRQEERRKKQEAARQKRAAGIGSRPKLGAKSD